MIRKADLIGVKMPFVEYQLGPVRELTVCPGQYCGRTRLENGNWSSCGACPRGYRANNASECDKCMLSPAFYDWLYLGFMALLPLVLHWFCIDLAAKRRRYVTIVSLNIRKHKPTEYLRTVKDNFILRRMMRFIISVFSFTRAILILHTSALLEVVSAAVLTLIGASPAGSITLYLCKVEQLADWYTMLHNPSPDYTQMLHCTQEAVYPLYTVIFIYYALCLGFMLLARPFLVSQFLPVRGKVAVYAALYFLPILVVIQAVFGGLLYYAFPFVTIILSVISSAAHFAFRLDQSMKSLLMQTVTDFRNMVILVGHWALHTYGIIAITQLKDVAFDTALIALVPFPAIFYILTSRFTDPNKLHVD